MSLKRRRLTIPFADAISRRAFMSSGSGGGRAAFKNIAFLGDSVTVGYTPITVGLPSFVDAVRTALQASGGATRGEGLVPTIPLYSARYTYTGTWTAPNYGPFGGASTFGGMGGARKSAVAGSTASIVLVGDHFDLYYVTDSSTAAFTVQIDSDSAITVGGSSGSPVFAKQTIAPVNGKAGAHTITITAPASGAVIFWGIAARSFTGGALVHRIAILGTVSADMLGGQLSSWLASLAPDLTVYGFEINDYQTNVPIATFTATLTTLINAAKSAGSAFALVATNAIQQTAYTPAQSEYVAALASLASSLGAAFFVNIFDRWGPYTTSFANGLAAPDGTHPSVAGHADMALAVNTALGLTAPVRSRYGIAAVPSAEYDMSTLADWGFGEGGAVNALPDANRSTPAITNAFAQVTASKLLFAPGAAHFTSGSLGAPTWNYLQNVSKFTAFKVYQSVSPAVSNGVGGEYVNFAYTVIQDSDGIKVQCGGSSIYGKGFYVADGNKHVVAVQYDGTQTGNAARLRVWLDGVPLSLSFSGTIPASLPNSAGGFQFGQIGAAQLVGDGAHSLVYADTNALSDADMATVAAALATKWSVAAPTPQATDAFGRANNPSALGVADTGQLWSSGTAFGISGGALYYNGSTNGAIATIPLATAAKVMKSGFVTDSLATRCLGFIPRFVDGSNYIAVRFSGANLVLSTVVGGSFQNKVITAHGLGTGAATFTAYATIYGAVVTIYVNAAQIAQYTLTSGEQAAFLAALNAGYWGENTSGVSSANATADNLAIY